MRRFYFKNTLKMKNLTIIGILLLGISGLLFYMTTNLEVEEFTLSHFMGIMGGVGIGLIIGGIVGYVSKGSSIKAEQKRKELILDKHQVKDKEKSDIIKRFNLDMPKESYINEQNYKNEKLKLAQNKQNNTVDLKVDLKESAMKINAKYVKKEEKRKEEGGRIALHSFC